MAKNSAARIKANAKYGGKTYELIGARARKTERLSDQLDIAATRAGTSKAAYILDAIRARLQADGISADDLPPLDDKNDGSP